MIEDKYIELMNREIDGLNSPELSAELKKYLAQHPQAQEHFSGLARVSRTLEQAEEISTPPDFYQQVLSNIDVNRYTPTPQQGWFAALGSFIESRLNRRLAFGGGLALGIAVYALFVETQLLNEPMDPAKISGSIGAQQSSENSVPLEKITFEQNVVKGEIRLSKSDRVITAEIALGSQIPVTFVIEFEPEHILFKGIVNTSGTMQGDIWVASDSFKVTNHGQSRFTVILGQQHLSAPRLRFKVLDAGEVAFDREVTLHE